MFSLSEAAVAEPPIPLEKLSRLVSFAGASDLREFAKRLAFKANSELGRYHRSSKDPENAYFETPLSEEEFSARSHSLRGVLETEVALPVDAGTALHEFIVPMGHLPKELNGFEILHLSDIHFRQNKKERPQTIFNLVEHLRDRAITPDLIVITGDIITKRPEDFNQAAIDCLDALPAKVDRAYVLGNHDFYGQGVDEVRACLKKIGFRDLTNSHLRVTVEGKSINFFGVDDHLEGRPVAPKIPLQCADEPNILVTHNLDALQRNYPKCLDLVLSGHTHAGEIEVAGLNGCHFMKLFGYLDILNRHIRGWNSLSNRTLSYISPGHAVHYFRYRTHQAGATLLKLNSAPSTL